MLVLVPFVQRSLLMLLLLLELSSRRRWAWARGAWRASRELRWRRLVGIVGLPEPVFVCHM